MARKIKTMILNIGSTNIKYAVFEGKVLVSKDKTTDLLKEIQHRKPDQIIVRVVFGGDKFIEPMELTSVNIKKLRKYDSFAPLHNPVTLDWVEKIMKKFKGIELIAVFDSAFHSTIKKDRKTIPISLALAKHCEISKYGYHGFSHQYIAQEYSRRFKADNYRIITCHLGGGSSVCAIENGQSVATSMGFGPEEGLMMVKRVGNIGANAILHILEKSGLSISDLRSEIYTNSGFLGLTGNDDIKSVFNARDEKSKLAVEVFVNSIMDYIGSYYILLKGADAVILTGGIGENSTKLQEIIREKVKFLGLDVIVIPTFEELMMLESVE
jgi:acetate kinase